MRASVLVDGSNELIITDVEHDAPLGREVLVRSVAAGLCHSDYHYLDGTLSRGRPVILGHEGAGVVEAVGPDVRDIAVGDHVVTCLVMGCGECTRCIAGEPTRCLHPEVTKRASGQPPRLHTRDPRFYDTRMRVQFAVRLMATFAAGRAQASATLDT